MILPWLLGRYEFLVREHSRLEYMGANNPARLAQCLLMHLILVNRHRCHHLPLGTRLDRASEYSTSAPPDGRLSDTIIKDDKITEQLVRQFHWTLPGLVSQNFYTEIGEI